MTRQDILPWGSLAISIAAAAIALMVAINPPIYHHLDGRVAGLETSVGTLNVNVSSLGAQLVDEAKAVSILRVDTTNQIDMATRRESADFRTLEAVINAMAKNAQTPVPQPMPDRHILAIEQQLRAVDHDLTALFNRAELRRAQGSGK